MAEEFTRELIESLAGRTGVASEDVAKVLDELGLGAAVEAAGEFEAGRLRPEHAKLAFRLARNSVAV
jgi:hypothetical protein